MPLVARELRLPELQVTQSTSGVNSVYTSSLLNLSNLMFVSTGSNPVDNWVGPDPIVMGRPVDQTLPHTIKYIHAIRWSSNINWLFGADNNDPSNSRRFSFWEYNGLTNQLTFRGSTLVTPPVAGNLTIQGFRAQRYVYTTGTVAGAINTSNIAGNGTTWTTDGIGVGARIGFGNTDPTQISQWYEISAVPSNVQITLGSNLLSAVASGTSYVIEEIRLAFATTNSTAVSGGLFLVKGLNASHFTLAGTTVGAATTTDNSRSCYYLTPASSQASNYETASCGLGLLDFVSWQSHSVYVLNGAGTSNARVTQYNLRAGLSLTSGRDGGSTLILSTGQQSVPAGILSQGDNGRVFTVRHGTASGSNSLWFVTNNRVVRAPTSSITNGSTTFITDNLIETPPGGTSTFNTSSAFVGVDYSTLLDKVVILNSGINSPRSYITEYRTDAGQLGGVFLLDTKQFNGNAADATAATYPNSNNSTMSIWIDDSRAYLTRIASGSNLNQFWVLPIGADYYYASNNQQAIITPRVTLPGNTRLRSVYVNEVRSIGAEQFSKTPETYKLFVRAAGIDDNSGNWTEVGSNGDLSYLGSPTTVQFKFEFRTISDISIPARIHNMAVVYETDDNILPELEWNLNDSNLNDGTIGFSQNALFSASVPNFVIEYYRSDTNTLVLTQNSLGTTNGTFQWLSASVWTGSLVSNNLGPNTVGTRRRFVPTVGLPANVNVYAKIKST